jgi:putative heme transporter
MPASRAAGTRRARGSTLPSLEVTDVEVAAPPEDGDLGVSAPKRKRPVWRVVQILLAVSVVAISFLYAIPKIANYSEVWTEIRDMTRLELLFLFAATALNLVTYWWANMVSIPNLGLWQAAVNNQTSTTVANTMPGGGYVSIAVSYEMYRAWGFSKTDVGLSVAVTSVLNIFAKLALPAIALLLIVLSGRASASLVGASIVGILILAVAVVLFGLVMWKKRFARSIGSGLGRAATWVARLLRRSRTFDWGDAAVRFRRTTIDFLVERWFWLTSTTILSHLSLYLVLLLALRFVGVSDAEVTWAQVLGVFAFGRLLTAIPITPGGLGIVEVAYIGGLILAGRGHADVPADVFHAQVTAAVLVFRALTYGIQIPLGALTYVIWRTNTSWRKPASIAAPEP